MTPPKTLEQIAREMEGGILVHPMTGAAGQSEWWKHPKMQEWAKTIRSHLSAPPDQALRELQTVYEWTRDRLQEANDTLRREREELPLLLAQARKAAPPPARLAEIVERMRAEASRAHNATPGEDVSWFRVSTWADEIEAASRFSEEAAAFFVAARLWMEHCEPTTAPIPQMATEQTYEWIRTATDLFDAMRRAYRSMLSGSQER